MRTSPIKTILMIILLIVVTASARELIRVETAAEGTITATIDPQAHIDYGFSYPLTWEILLPDSMPGYSALIRHGLNQPWTVLEEKTSDDFFNGITKVRFDLPLRRAYVSAGFSAESDSLIIQIVRPSGLPAQTAFVQISRYYDNRDAAVTCSADDMAGWSQAKFKTALTYLRSFRLWTTIGINSAGCNASTYSFIQSQLDSGYVEAGAHSRSHPDARPYSNYDSEITGNKLDIINNLDLPPLFRSGDREYVYTWIAPNGYVDDVVDSLLGQNHFLVNRLYYKNYFDGFSPWNSRSGTYQPIGVTRAFDPPRSVLGWGIGSNDIRDLNNAFNKTMNNQGVYHLMCHPNVVEWNKDYVLNHLRYVSGRNNVWYAGLGHAFLYHLAQENTVHVTSQVAENLPQPQSFELEQNYPNPFNPATTISYRIGRRAKVRLSVYNMAGQLVDVPVDGIQEAGSYRLLWRGDNLPSGLYLYILEAGSRSETKKMMLIK